MIEEDKINLVKEKFYRRFAFSELLQNNEGIIIDYSDEEVWKERNLDKVFLLSCPP